MASPLAQSISVPKNPLEAHGDKAIQAETSHRSDLGLKKHGGPPVSFHAMYDGTKFQPMSLNRQPSINHQSSQPSSGAPSQLSSAPRRESFPDILPEGHNPPPPINVDLLYSRGRVPGVHTAVVSQPHGVHTSDFGFSTPASRMGPAPLSTAMIEPGDASMIIVAGQRETPATAEGELATVTKSSGSRRNKKYTLPDGSVVSGKGLGRGRPGIKRGPRKSQPGDPSSPQSATLDPGDAGTAEGDAPYKKRKSSTSDASSLRAHTVDSAVSNSRGSSEEYNPSSQTRSGRQTQKPIAVPNLVAAAASASPSVRKARNNSTTNVSSNSPASIKTHPKIKRRVYRGREQFALCEHCLRGHGPPGNVIVFCDACNKCWHQRCHEPQISKQTVADSKADWFCSDCDRILHGKKKDKKTNGKIVNEPPVTPLPLAQQAPTYAGPLVGGRFVPPEQKLAYLKTLSKDDLVSRLLHASNLAPDLPIFQTLVPPPPPPIAMRQAQFTSTYVTPVSKVPSFGDKDAVDDGEVDEGYDGYFDEHAALYPKPGHGLQLPPESEDMHMLLEGKESTTFSHRVYNFR